MQQIRIPNQNKRTLYCERLYLCNFQMVNLTTTQVETLFGELEYIELQLKVLGILEVRP